MSSRILTIAVEWFSLSILCGVAWVALLLLIDLCRTLGSGAPGGQPDVAASAGTVLHDLDQSAPQAPATERRSPEVSTPAHKPAEPAARLGEDIAA